MPLKCYICKFYDPKKASLFRIPDRNDEYSDRCGLWLKLLEEKKENMHRIRICADHFLNSILFTLKTYTFIPTLHYITTIHY